MLARRDLAGTMIPDVIRDRAVDDYPIGGCDVLAALRHGDEQLLLAVVAAVTGVLAVPGSGQLIGWQHDVARTNGLGQRLRFLQLTARQGRRIRCHGNYPIAKHVTAHAQQRSRIDTC